MSIHLQKKLDEMEVVKMQLLVCLHFQQKSFLTKDIVID